MSPASQVRLLIIASLAFVFTLATLSEAKGWNILFPVGLLPLELGVAAIMGRSLFRQAHEELKMKSELAADAVTVPCSRCGRLNSVRTCVCPRCDQHL